MFNKRALGYKHTPEARQKISERMMGNKYTLGRKHTDEEKEKISLIHKGKIVSKETREKISKSNIGKSAWNKGIPHTAEAKIKIGLKSIGRKWTKNQRDIIYKKQKIRNEIWKKEHPFAYRSRQLKRKYGITIEGYNLILKEQNFSCAICKSGKPGGMGSFPVDHDHKTGKIRGLLCNQCNFGLGAFKDNEDILLKAINYLRKNNGEPKCV
jgi:hypothetical protein